MQQKQPILNRKQRRAAERAALKNAIKTSNAAVVVATGVLPAQRSVPPSANPTGPRTDAGKQSSSRNAIKHGGCAVSTLILNTESYDDFLALEVEVFQRYQLDPDDPTANPGEVALIREAVRANWFYCRSENNYSETEAKMLNEAPNTLMWGDDHHTTLARFQRYRTANYNLLVKARKAVDDYRKARIREAAEAAKIQREDQKLTMAKERLEIYRVKNKPFDFDEEIEAMTQKAIRLGFHDPDPLADSTGE